MNFLANLRFTLRLFLKNFNSSAIAVFILATGLALSITMFKMSSTMLWSKPSLNTDSDLLEIDWVPTQGDRSSWKWKPNFPDYQYIAENTTTLGKTAAWSGYFTAFFNPESDSGTENINGARVTPSFFDLLNVKPILGRLANDVDASGANGEIILIGHELWHNKFNADPNVVGTSVFLSGKPHTIIGVMPEGFQFPTSQHLWKVYDWRSDVRQGPKASGRVTMLATVKEGVSLKQVQAEMNKLGSELHQASPKTHKDRNRLTAGDWSAFGDGFHSTILMLFFGSILVLLTACANISNLLLARVNARQFELGMRKVLGARRRELAGYVVLDALLIASVGLFFAFIMAAWATRFIWNKLYNAYGQFTPHWWDMNLDWTVIVYGTLIMLLAVLVASLSPLLKLVRRFNIDVIKDSARTTSGAAASKTGRVLITTQILMASILLSTAAVYSMWLKDMNDFAMPFDPNEVLFNRVMINTAGAKEAEDVDRFFENFERNIRAIDGVRDVSFAFNAMDTDQVKRPLHIEGAFFDEENPEEEIASNIVSAGYFETFKATALEGRFFNDFDDKDSMPVAVVDSAFAEYYFPGESAIGKRVRVRQPGNEWERQNRDMESPWTEWLTIVGVTSQVETMKGYDQALRAGRHWQYHHVYIPLKQRTSRNMYLMVTGEGNVLQYADGVSKALAKENSMIAPMFRYETLQDYLDVQNTFMDVVSSLIILFGVLALVMAAVGLYGIATFSTQRKARDFAIRRALGARKTDIVNLVLNSAYWQLGIGLCLGLTAAHALLRLIAVSQNIAEKVNVSFSTVLLVYVAVAALVAVIMLFSVFVPAWRVANLPPNASLRAE